MKLLKKWILMLLVTGVFIMPAVNTEAADLITSVVEDTGSVTELNGLVKRGSKLYYYNNGKMLKSSWKRYNGKKYYFGTNGYAARGGHIINKQVYVFDDNCCLMENKANRIVTASSRRFHIKDKYGHVSTGYFIYKNNLYFADSRGRLDQKRYRQNGQLYFTASGAARKNYNALLKMQVMKIVESITTPQMSKSQKLYACWKYVVYDGFYYGGPDPDLDQKGWARQEALRMFNTGVGNCYGFSCIFAALAREVGYNPYMICGRVPGSRDGAADGYTRHCWVRIDGLYYDPEAQYAGWMTGVYGDGYYPIGHQIQRIVNFSTH